MFYKILFFLTFSLSAYALKPVEFVSIKKFSGLWYEIARTPNSYQQDCVASSVEYVLQDDNTYEIYNRCFENRVGGKLIEYFGVGKSASKNKNSIAKIEMTYFWIFTEKYNVVYIDEAYENAVVSDENKEHIWIMSRNIKIKKDKLNTILKSLEPYVDLNSLIFTKQDSQGRYK